MLSFLNAKRTAPPKNDSASVPPILTLPAELLIKIASCVPDGHPYYGYPVESANLVSLSFVSRLMRVIAIPLLYCQIPITSEHQLNLLCMAPAKLLESVQCVQLNI